MAKQTGPETVPTSWLNTTQAAEYLRLSPRTLADMRVAGRGPRCRRVSHRHVLYHVNDLDRWVIERDLR